jgi:hypothetical protein
VVLQSKETPAAALAKTVRSLIHDSQRRCQRDLSRMFRVIFSRKIRRKASALPEVQEVLSTSIASQVSVTAAGVASSSSDVWSEGKGPVTDPILGLIDTDWCV